VPDGCIDLATGNPDPSLLPRLDSAWRSLPSEPALYDEPPETRALTTFARAELAADGVESDSVVVTSGALDAIERVLREHLRPGDRVAIEDPGYPALVDLIAASGLKLEPVAIDRDGPKPEALDTALKRHPSAVILTPRAQNPSGAAITPDRADDLRTILKRHRAVLLIENDPLGPVAGAPAVTLSSDREHWVVVRSTSKFLGPDLRVAILAGDAMTLARVRRRQAVGPRWTSRVLQHLALATWSDPSSGRQLARAAEIYAQRRQQLIEALGGQGITVHARSGFNLWIPVLHEASVVQRLIENGWAVAAGERFRIHSGPAIRVTTSALAGDAGFRFAHDLGAVRSMTGIPA
jgi:DNA-binding transcriptional MocR family regulator